MNKFNLSAEVTQEINAQVLAMLATGTSYLFDETTFEDFASSIHNLTDLSVQLGPEGVAARSEILRKALAEKGVTAPADEDFVYFGGRCVTIPTMFIPKASREEVAEKMADDIIRAMFSEEESSTETVVDALVASAAMDDILLSMRTKALARKVTEAFPDYAMPYVVGNFTFLPDGTVLPLHYLNEHDDEWSEADYDEDCDFDDYDEA